LSGQLSDRLDLLDAQTKQIAAALLTSQQNPPQPTSTEIRDQTLTLTQLLSRTGNSDYENCQTRASVVGGIHFNHDQYQGDEIWARNRIIRSVEMFDVSQEEEDFFRSSVLRKILAGLEFSAMTQRYEDVADAHQDTFEWIFHDQTAQQVFWTNFSDWLTSGSGIYWVNGKAGSGKSTLLKFIYDDSRTKAHLRSWAATTPLATAAFFFWNSGTSDQKSQAGLLRTILHDIWSQYPQLIPILIPLEWARTYSQLLNKAGAYPIFWSLKKLMEIFKNLVNQTVVPLKFVLFVDGLDEYEGDHQELGEFFNSISCSPHVKVCVSSRPWVVFQDLFGDRPSLRLQDLTRADIECFVVDKFGSSEIYQRLKSNDSSSALTLVQEIVDKSDGVFLWVKLVVRSLLEGFRNRDTIPDLQKRLRLFPRELEPLYDHLFSLIEPFYMEWASMAFQIMRAAQSCRDCIVSTDATPPLTTLSLYLAMNEEKSPARSPRITSGHIQNEAQDITFQLTARCAGLLEVKDGSQERHLQYTFFGITHKPIKWLHRTARDYIEHPSKWNELVALTARTQFNPSASLLRSCVDILEFEKVEVAPTIQDEDSRRRFDDHVWFLSNAALLYAFHSDCETRNPQCALLDRLSILLSTPNRDGDIALLGRLPNLLSTPDMNGDIPYKRHILQREAHSSGTALCRASENATFREFLVLAVKYGLVAYVREKLRHRFSGHPIEASYASMLQYIPIIGHHSRSLNYPPPRFEMVELFLQLGADPNAPYSGKSAWEEVLCHISEFSHGFPSLEYGREYFRIVSLLIRYGASPFTEIMPLAYGMGREADAPNHTLTALQVLESARSIFPEEVDGLLHALRNRNHPRHEDRRNDRRRWERRERIDNDYACRRRRR
jgi:hypothetical protein